MAGNGLTIQLSVGDLGTTLAFYGGILGLPVQRALTAVGAPEHLVLTNSGCQILFVEDEALAQIHPLLAIRLASMPRGIGMTMHLTVKGLNGIYLQLLAEEQEILQPLRLMPYGTYELWCLDPDGYLVVLEEPAGAPLPA